MIRSLLTTTLIVFSLSGHSQNLGAKVDKAVQSVYKQYSLFFDSSQLEKYVVLDKNKSYLVNAQNQKIKTLAVWDDSFIFDEFSLAFAIVYKGDTIRHLPTCRLDTYGNLMALGTPSNPIQHGDLLPPYQELVKGNIKFDYKKLCRMLKDMNLEATAVNLQKVPNTASAKHSSNQLFNWRVTTTCPEITCKEILISATSGKIQAD